MCVNRLMVELKILKFKNTYYFLIDLFPYSIDLPYAHGILETSSQRHRFYRAFIFIISLITIDALFIEIASI